MSESVGRSLEDRTAVLGAPRDPSGGEMEREVLGRVRVKPRLFKAEWAWACVSPGGHAFGASPAEAYLAWRRRHEK